MIKSERIVMNVNEEKLAAVVQDLEDFDEATIALTELKHVNPERAGEIASNILENGKGDSHFQASAFEILYSVNQPGALFYIENNSELVDLVVFRSMLESVTEDSSLVQINHDLLLAAKTLKARADRLSSQDCQKIGDVLEWFKSSFSDVPV
jgi:PHD/YefM family antitoxin component YafN of YafNO toxin-antitoxin module